MALRIAHLNNGVLEYLSRFLSPFAESYPWEVLIPHFKAEFQFMKYLLKFEVSNTELTQELVSLFNR